MVRLRGLWLSVAFLTGLSFVANVAMLGTKAQRRLVAKISHTPIYSGASHPKMVDFLHPPLSSDRMHFDAGMPPREKALVTVIVPTTSSHIFLNDTIACVKAQTLQLFKIVIVADNVTREEFDSIASEQERDNRVKVVFSEGGSLSISRNVGMSHVDTEFVVPLDDDDLIEVTFLEKLVWVLKSNPEFSYANSFSVAFGAKQYHWMKLLSENSFLENKQVATAMFRVAALKQVSHWPNVYDEDLNPRGGLQKKVSSGSEDWDLWLRLREQGLVGITVPEMLFWYRIKGRRRKWDFSENHFSLELRKKRFPRLAAGNITYPVLSDCDNCVSLDPVGFENVHEKLYPVLVLIIPWMALGGADMVNAKTVELLTKAGWKVIVICTLATSGTSSTSADLEFIRPIIQQYTEEIFVLPHFLRMKDYAQFLSYIIISRSADAVMVSNSFAGYNLLPYLKTRHPTVAFVDYVHMRQLNWTLGGYLEERQSVKPGGYPHLSAVFSNWIDLSLFVSKDEMDWVLAHDPPTRRARELKTAVCYYGVDVDFFQPSRVLRAAQRKLLGVSENVTVVLFSGRLVEQKRPLLMIRLFEKAAFLANIHLVICGSGVLEKELVEYVKLNRLTHVTTFLGAVKREKMKQVLAGCDILFMPSDFEGLSISLLEAMAMEVVPVATNVGGQGEVLDFRTGCLADLDDYDRMVSCLVGIAKDPLRRRKLASNARDVILSKFSTQTMSSTLTTKLDEVCSRAKKNAGLTPHVGVEDLRKAVSALHWDNSALSNFVVRTNLQNYQREDRFERELAFICSEDGNHSPGGMSAWIDGVAHASVCEPNVTEIERVRFLTSLKAQCGQYCLFSCSDPETGWVFDGRSCFYRFGRKHPCHDWADLKQAVMKSRRCT